ncbi:hypothetical protein N878_20090 [Pseudomonas sp. EGD-AK9]|nr:hypothetical protein N878_20090 [Pseudomonas sp. EGD-AK9]
MAILESGAASHQIDRRIAFEDAFIFSMTQLVHTGLLLRQQTVTQDNWGRCRQSHVKRTFASQMSDMRCPNHDLRRDAAHVDAGAADSSPLDQGDTGTVFSCLQRCCHSGAASTDDRHMQLTCRFLHRALAAQPLGGFAKESWLFNTALFAFKFVCRRSTVTKGAHCCYERGHVKPIACDLRLVRWIIDSRSRYAGDRQQRVLNVPCTTWASHSRHAQTNFV